MFRVAIVDDNAEHAERTRGLVERQLGGDSQIRVVGTSQELLAAASGFVPEIAVLDIQLSDESGIDLAEKLVALCPDCQIIFLTSFLSYAMDVYKAEHVYFVTKDRAEAIFPLAIKRAVEKLRFLRESMLVFKLKGETLLVKQSDIICMERVQRKTFLVCTEEQYEVPDNFDTLLPQLDSLTFCMCHRSFIVNFQHVHKLRYNGFIMADKRWVPIGRRYGGEAKMRFTKYLHNAAF